MEDTNSLDKVLIYQKQSEDNIVLKSVNIDIHEENKIQVDEDIFSSIIEDFCSNLDAKITLHESKNYEQHKIEEKVAMFSFEQHEPNHSNMHEIKVVQKEETSKESSKFILSQGCPIRHLAKMDANEAPQVMLSPKHEVATKE